MPRELTKKLTLLTVLGLTIVAHGILDFSGMFRDATTATIVTAAMVLVAALTYPRQSPRRLNWIGVVVATAALSVTGLNAVLQFFFPNFAHPGFGWIAVTGLGFVTAVTLRRLLLLIDDLDAIPSSAKAASGQAA